MEEKQIRVLLIEDNEALGASLLKHLEEYPEIKVVGICEDRDLAVRTVCSSGAEVAVINLYPGDSSSDIIHISREIRIHTDAKVLILSESEDLEFIVKAARNAFASGCLFNWQIAQLGENIITMCEGYTVQEYLLAFAALSCLSEAEMAVFHIMMGKKVPLKSSPKTIANQKTRVLKKLGLANQKDLRHVFVMFRENGENV